MEDIEILNYGDSGLLIKAADTYTKEAWEITHTLTNIIRKKNIEGVLSIVPTLTTVYLHFDLFKVKRKVLVERIEELIAKIQDSKIALEGDLYEVPLVFGGEYGPDLEEIAKEVNRTPEQLINDIAGKENRILAFSRGPMMESPIVEKVDRLKSPRTSVPAGTLGIAFNQISISAIDAPSGWKALGRSPAKLLDEKLDPPGVLKPGDFIRFVPISEEEFDCDSLKQIKRVVGNND